MTLRVRIQIRDLKTSSLLSKMDLNSRSKNVAMQPSVSDIPLTQQAASMTDDTDAQIASRRRTFDADFDEGDSSAAPAYPPVDGGKDAWLFLAGAFTIGMYYIFQINNASIGVILLY